MPIIIGEFIQYLNEEAMTSKERNDLEDDEFGIPELRKFPINDKKHVEQAIKMFNHVDKKYESELADNILDAMEKFHISTDIVGEKNRLKKYIKEDSVVFTEGLIWNDNTPNDIKRLKEDIKDLLDKNVDDVDSIDDVIDNIQAVSKNADTRSAEKKIFIDVCKKSHINIYGYTVKSSNVKGIEISTYNVIGRFKDYILTIVFTGTAGNVRLNYININYTTDKCDIPKNIVFDLLNMVKYVDKVRCTKRSILISALPKEIDYSYPNVSHKYSNKYKVRKNFAGTAIKISLLDNSVEENAIAGALPRQDYQPDAVYLINYTNRNTFESDIAICKDKMSDIFICKDNKPKHISLTDFNKLSSNIKMYQCLLDTDFDQIIKESTCGLDFYKNMVNEEVTNNQLENDYRFRTVMPYIAELDAIKECIINSAPKHSTINEFYCPIIPLLEFNNEDSIVHYYRDIDGVFAQNINTLNRSASYKSVEQIPESVIKILTSL